MATDYTVTELEPECITVDSPALTLEPMETESERHARLIETANRSVLTPEQVADHIVRRDA